MSLFLSVSRNSIPQKVLDPSIEDVYDWRAVRKDSVEYVDDWEIH